MTKPIQELEELTRQAVHEVFQSMVSIEVTPEAPGLIADTEGEIVSSVGFVGEVTNGVIYLSAGVSFVRMATSKMLGIAEHEVDSNEMVNDAFGELTNMVAGYVKTRLSNNGRPCALTIPSIVRGQRLTVEGSAEVTRKIIGFRNGTHHFMAELLLKAPAKTK
jgi:chemotaxis protein CheX